MPQGVVGWCRPEATTVIVLKAGAAIHACRELHSIEQRKPCCQSTGSSMRHNAQSNPHVAAAPGTH